MIVSLPPPNTIESLPEPNETESLPVPVVKFRAFLDVLNASSEPSLPKTTAPKFFAVTDDPALSIPNTNAPDASTVTLPTPARLSVFVPVPPSRLAVPTKPSLMTTLSLPAPVLTVSLPAATTTLSPALPVVTLSSPLPVSTVTALLVARLTFPSPSPKTTVPLKLLFLIVMSALSVPVTMIASRAATSFAEALLKSITPPAV